ncbi:MAG: LmbE family protein [Acidimicrobiaceae bacterium]|nr:LmbE family protein [Acidimicrobiaceae bacterium]
MSDPTLDSPAPERVLVITAHPDDVDFGAAGTVARWTAAGVEVSYCIVTDGGAGSVDPTLERSEIPAIRQVEQRAAAKLVGVEDVTFLGWRDGELVADLALRRELAAQIRRVRPDIVLCPSPEIWYDRLPASHPDHRAAGEAALAAVYPDARNPYAFPELLEAGLEPHSVPEVWIMAHPVSDRAVDVTDQMEAKIAAICAHVSQVSDPERVSGFVREWTSAEALNHGFGEGRHAESFKVIRLG